MSLYLKHRIVCFVCGTEGPADYPLYTSPHGAMETVRPLPHFPFLLELAPPLGCRSPAHSSAAHSCRSCYSSLMRQWDDNERGGVAVENRVCCHKRTGGLPVLTRSSSLRSTELKWQSFPSGPASTCLPLPTDCLGLPAKASRCPPPQQCLGRRWALPPPVALPPPRPTARTRITTPGRWTCPRAPGTGRT